MIAQRSVGWVLATLLCLVPALAQASGVLVPDGPPLVFDPTSVPNDAVAVAVSADGTRVAAVVVAGPDDQPRSTLLLRLPGTEAPGSIEVPGLVRDLLFTDSGNALWAIQHRPGRRAQTTLLRVEPTTLRTHRELPLATSARSLAFWPRRNALLVGGRDEIRTILLPELRSGSIYPVTGENRAIAILRGNLLLVGQSERVALVDLDDRPGREAMPIRDEVPIPAPAIALAVRADSASALLGLADTRAVRLDAEPLAIGEDGGAGVVANRATPVSVISRATPPVEAVAAVPVAAPVPDPTPPPTPSAADTAATAPETPQSEPIQSDPQGEPQRSAPVVAAETSLPPPSQAGPAARGTIAGEAADRVVAVVLLGPDNVLREAARMKPDAQGRWSVAELTPGRYRVVLDGGGGAVLVSEPPFHVLEVSSESTATADFHVRRSF